MSSLLVPVKDEDELAALKERLFGTSTTRSKGTSSARPTTLERKEGGGDAAEEKKKADIARSCACGFRDRFPHRHFVVKFEESSLGIKYSKGKVLWTKISAEKYGVERGDYIFAVSNKRTGLFERRKNVEFHDLIPDRRILKHFMTHQKRPLRVEFVRFEGDRAPPVLGAVSRPKLSPRPMLSDAARRRWTAVSTDDVPRMLRRRGSSDDRFLRRKSELLEEARTQKIEWILSDWQSVARVREHMRRSDGTEKRDASKENRQDDDVDIRGKNAMTILSDLDLREEEPILLRGTGRGDESTSPVMGLRRRIERIEALMKECSHVLDCVASGRDYSAEKMSSSSTTTTSAPTFDDGSVDVLIADVHSKVSDPSEAWFVDVFCHCTAAPIAESARQFIRSIFEDKTQRKDNAIETNAFRTSSFLENIDLEDESETFVQSLAMHVRKFIRHLQRRTYAHVENVEKQNGRWDNDRRSFAKHAIIEGCEKLLTSKLYDVIYGSLDIENVQKDEDDASTVLEDRAAQDAEFHELASAHSFVTFAHLDIPAADEWETCVFRAAKEELQAMFGHRAPGDKMMRIMNCCRLVSDVLQDRLASSETPAGADDFFPLLVMIVLHANPSHVCSDLHYIQLYRDPNMMRGEVDYFFQSAVGAVEFIRHLSVEKLTISPQEYQTQRAIGRMRSCLSDRRAASNALLVPRPDMAGDDDDDDGVATWKCRRYRFVDVEPSALSVSDLDDLCREHGHLLDTIENLRRERDWLASRNAILRPASHA